jgi:RNA polymerase sigma-70 factor (ECF subfamily)
LRRLGVAERDREDLANEVFVRVNEHLDQYDPARPIRPWVFLFAFRAASDYRRLARHRREVHDPVDAPAPGRGPDDDALLREKQRVVLAALDELDEPKRVVFVMHDIDEIPVPEISRVLGIAEGTAYTRLRAARALFTRAARARYGESPQ